MAQRLAPSATWTTGTCPATLSSWRCPLPGLIQPASVMAGVGGVLGQRPSQAGAKPKERPPKAPWRPVRPAKELLPETGVGVGGCTQLRDRKSPHVAASCWCRCVCAIFPLKGGKLKSAQQQTDQRGLKVAQRDVAEQPLPSQRLCAPLLLWGRQPLG